MSAKEIVESSINENTIAVFSKSWCPYCRSAKDTISKDYPDAEVKIYELDEMDEGEKIQAYLAEKTGQRTVPNIFINKQHVGGNDAIQNLKRKGELDKLVNKQ
ncbi:Glutaredoxin [Marasmius tenuissimus]|uniref:Glutaredoxin n=1 Tax=Marasmius tenuissimus TaxID=585030 RepID=A0ABR3A817_9AGAR|nr:Glutaredoxin [Marasmius tenuissimus]